MFDAQTLMLFYVGALVVNLAPGPDMLFVVARSVAQGTSAGAIAVLGIFLGCTVHILAAALGLSALFKTVPLAYDIVRIAGAAYLIYIGLRGLFTRDAAEDRRDAIAISYWVSFRQAFYTNILNPKVALFFLAFLPQFADPAHGSLALQVLILGLIFDINGCLILLVVAMASGRAGLWLKRKGLRAALNRVAGGVFVALGLKLAFDSQKRG
jgi:threonine/homoserine/homoserine lactone efflux protein